MWKFIVSMATHNVILKNWGVPTELIIYQLLPTLHDYTWLQSKAWTQVMVIVEKYIFLYNLYLHK